MSSVYRAQRIAAWLCGVGILLQILGYEAVRYIPMTDEQAHQERILQEVTLPAAERATREYPPHVRMELLHSLRETSIRNRVEPPLRLLGRVAFALGMVCLVGGLLLWFRFHPSRYPPGWVRENEDV